MAENLKKKENIGYLYSFDYTITFTISFGHCTYITEVYFITSLTVIYSYSDRQVTI